jgi:hypothetical protein
VATVVNELVTKFGFSGSIGPLLQFNDKLSGSIGFLGKWTLGLSVAAAGFSVYIGTVLRGVDALDALGNQTDVTVAKIQEMNYIAGQMQSSSSAVESTIRGLSNTIGAAAQHGSDDFARLGISVRDANGQVKDAVTILGEVSSRFSRMRLSMQEKTTLASALGIDASMIKMLSASGKEMDALRAKARAFGVLTGADTKRAAMYQRAINSVTFGVGALKDMIAIGLAPELTRLADKFSNFLLTNGKWIKDGIETGVKWIGRLFDALGRTGPLILKLTLGFAALKYALMSLTKVPILLLFTALFLAVDDLVSAFRGGKSVIAAFFRDTFDVDIVEAITEGFEALKGMTTGLSEAFTEAFDATPLEAFAALIASIVEGFKYLNKFGGALGSRMARDTATSNRLRQEYAAKRAAEIAEAGPSWWDSVTRWFGAAPATTTSGGSTIQQAVQIEVHTSDPLAAGNNVAEVLQRQLDNANEQLNVGGK